MNTANEPFYRRAKILAGTLSLIVLGLALLLYDATAESSVLAGQLGLALVTSSALTLLYDSFHFSELRAQISDTLREARLEDGRLLDAGIREVVDGGQLFEEMYRRSSKRSGDLDIMQTWSPNLDRTIRKVETSLLKGHRARILLLHPESPFARQRSRDLCDAQDVGERVTRAKDELFAALQRISESSGKDVTSNVELRFYNKLPSFSLYRFGDAAWIGWFWNGRQADAGPNVCVDATQGNSLWDNINEHFESLWESSKIMTVGLGNTALPKLREH